MGQQRWGGTNAVGMEARHWESRLGGWAPSLSVSAKGPGESSSAFHLCHLHCFAGCAWRQRECQIRSGETPFCLLRLLPVEKAGDVALCG